MPFTSYRETVAYGAMIDYVTRTGYMPPWRAATSYGTFDHSLQLSAAELDRIARWVKGGFARGPELMADAWKAYRPRPAPEPEWDLELTMIEPFEQYGIYFDQYQVFRLPTGLTEDRWVAAVGFEPGDASIVRYVSVSVNTDPAAARLDDWDPRYGYTSFGGPGMVPDTEGWFTWSPGDPPFSQGPNRFLPAGAELLLYVHYGPTGQQKTDRSMIRLKFADPKPGKPASRHVALFHPAANGAESFTVPAGEEHWVQSSLRLPVALTVHALEPHGLLLANAWEIYARRPDGGTVKLLKIPDYDVHWRRAYRLAAPLTLPAGTVVHARARYDNRAGNPALPDDRPVAAGWGATIFDEQFLLRFRLTLPPPAPGFRILPTAGNQRDTLRRVRCVLPAGAEGSYRLRLRSFGEVETNLTVPLEAGVTTADLSLNDLPYGTYALLLEDAEGRYLAGDLLVYWPPELTKTILDD